ncbi:anthrone oxygenase family protein [Pseudonocardia broussonetiae]|uniref:anthrone oxygenase family protein n=1 Tax=Pseudonocardia broussonetiae TaxID=2736640 RepID=UPI001964BADC|nr:anthrone oxygenase family protein [Pseudonocardia broussonetiae]
MTVTEALRVVAGVGCGLVAGLLFAFSAGVMTALRNLPAGRGAAAMRSVNAAVLNPLFLGVFGGAGVAAVATAVASGGAPAVVGAAVLYVVGVLGVTAAVSVPLNDALAAERVPWELYLVRWTRWNHVRAGAATAALGLLLVA